MTARLNKKERDPVAMPEISELQEAVEEISGSVGANSGIAQLDSSGKLPSAQLPALAKGDVGLGDVDNTADANKPVSDAQQDALDLKADEDDARFPTADEKAALNNPSGPPLSGDNGVVSAAALESEATTRSGADSTHLAASDPHGDRAYADSLVSLINGFLVAQGKTYSAVMAVDAPYLWWKLDEASGTTANDSGSAGTRDGTIGGTPTLGSTGFTTQAADDAMTFDGSDDYVQWGSASLADVFTLEAWVKQTATGAYGLIIGADSTSKGAYLLLSTSGRVTLHDNEHNVDLRTTQTQPVNDTNWHHVAVTKDGSNIRIFVDAIEYTTWAVQNDRTLGAWGVNLRAGFASNYAWAKFAGLMQHVAVHKDVALSPTRIAAHYFAGALGRQ